MAGRTGKRPGEQGRGPMAGGGETPLPFGAAPARVSRTHAPGASPLPCRKSSWRSVGFFGLASGGDFLSIPGRLTREQVRMSPILRPLAALALLLFALPAHAAQCGGDFATFLAAFGREAQGAGVSRSVVDQAFGGLTADPAVLAFDRRQRYTFRKSFEEYARTRVVPARINRAKALLARHAALLARVEARFGVPKEIVVAIWTLETDNGADMGKLPVVRTLATLAHDCRRSDLFQRELLAALQILQRGDLPLRDLVGAYAGEIGQTQFLPSSYIKYGVDFDGDGHVNLRHSVPDVLASTANLLRTHGWQTGGAYGEGTANFQVMYEWNRSEVYRKTIGYFADKLR